MLLHFFGLVLWVHFCALTLLCGRQEGIGPTCASYPKGFSPQKVEEENLRETDNHV